jgi:hypothetical protein
MHRFLIGLVIGTLAGVVDIVPMLLMRSSKTDLLSAFIHWLVLGLLLAHLGTPLPKWVEGIAVALLAAIPVIILVAPRDVRAVIPMLASSIILGGFSGLALGALAA